MGAIGFILFILLQGRSFPIFSNQEYNTLVISGIIGVAIGDILFLASLRRLGSSLSAIVSTSYSLFVFILAYLMFDEVISTISYLGGVLVITGVIIGTNERSIKTTPKQLVLGVFYGLFAHLCTAYSILLIKPIMELHPIVPIALIRFSLLN